MPKIEIMMNAIDFKTIDPDKLYSPQSYLSYFERLVEEGKTSGPVQSEALIEYTKLNWQRSRRILKTGNIEPALSSLLKELPVKMDWYIITEPWCGDAAQILPWIMKMEEASDGKIELKLILRDEHPDIMDAYLTNGGRSIPKIIALDESGKEIFNWGPRPKVIQELFMQWKSNPSLDSKTLLHKWYADNKGNEIQKEFSSLLKGI